MKRLIIYPTFLCPFACAFCSSKNKNSLNEMIDLKLLSERISDIKDYISEIVISGGEPMSWDKLSFISLIETIKPFGKKITVESYPYILNNYTDSVNWNFSYDFMIRPRALDVWENLMRIKSPYSLTVTISPMLFKLYPNAILYKLNLLENLREVEFIPYCKNDLSQFDITKNDTLTKFNKMLLSNKMNLNYTLKNKTNLVNKMLGEYNKEVDICILPDGKLYYKDFDGDILKFKELSQDILFKSHPLVYPKDIDLYNDEIVSWAKENAII